MATDRANQFRVRAAQARRISDNMHNRKAQIELRDMADALDEEAKRLDEEEATTTKPSNKPSS